MTETQEQPSESNPVNPVELGFAETCENEPWLLTNRYFPSKIGGLPSWLELRNLPKQDDLACSKCGEPCVFLCQVYAPIESNPECFHRTIFLFVCRNEKCCLPNESGNLIVFRNQLKRENDYYSSTPPNEFEQLPAIESLETLCKACGCYGQLMCSGCKKVTYCSKFHQKIDWKNGHKEFCKGTKVNTAKAKSLLFSEFELVIEADAEAKNVDNVTACTEELERLRLEEYENLVKSGKVTGLDGVTEEELEPFAAKADNDKQFRRFKKTIESNPEQVLRYQLNGEPLWITNKTKVYENTVPNCEQCGFERIFEFQIMPQMLNYIKDDRLDWGIIAIYTCKKSCNTKGHYLREYIIKQDLIVEQEKTEPTQNTQQSQS